MFREPDVEPVELDTDEEDLTPFYDAPDEPVESVESPRPPLESVESVDSPGVHTLPHTVLARSIYQIITQLRAVNQQMWQLRARINCSKGDLLVNTTMSVSSLLPIPQQEAMANSHLDFLILQACTVKRRNKKPKDATNATTPRRSSSRSASMPTPSPAKFAAAKKDGRSSNCSMLRSPHGRPGIVDCHALQQALHALLCRHSCQFVAPPADIISFEERKPSRQGCN
jgi:hypothetical protein